MSSERFNNYSGGKYSQSNKSADNDSDDKITNLKTMLVIIFIISIIILFFIMYISQYVQLSRKSLMVEKLEDKKRRLESKKEHLQLEIARLKSLNRVERIAKQELNMEEPDNINYIVIDSSEEHKNKQGKDNQKITQQQEETKDKLSFNLEEQVKDWFKDLTTVQAGTLKKNSEE
ncbi:MAG: cell division protein FtsL [Halanaerobacter sp.]